LTTATTGSVSITPAPATQWVISTQPPATVTAGAAFGLTVTAQDTFGNTATSFSSSVTVALGANPGGANPGGTLTRTASAGATTFNDLPLNLVGAGYPWSAPGSGLSAAPTSPLSVNAAAPQWVVTTQPPSSVTAGAGFGMVLKAEDGFGNVDPNYSGTVTVAL